MKYLEHEGKYVVNEYGELAIINPTVYTLLTDVPELEFDLDGLPCWAETFNITTQGDNHWIITSNRLWLTCYPESGYGNMSVDVFVAPGVQASGTLLIESSAPDNTMTIYRISSCL